MSFGHDCLKWIGTTVLPRYNANIETLPFFGTMAGWHYGEGGDLGLWIYAQLININSDIY